MITPENLPPTEPKSRFGFARPFKESLQRQLTRAREDPAYVLALGQVIFDVALVGAVAVLVYQKEGPLTALQVVGGVYLGIRLVVYHIPRIAGSIQSRSGRNR